MRTTISLDDDILTAARYLAQRDGHSIGDVVSALARRGLQQGAERRPPGSRNGIPLLPVRAGAVPVDLELVNRLRDEST